MNLFVLKIGRTNETDGPKHSTGKIEKNKKRTERQTNNNWIYNSIYNDLFGSVSLITLT